MALKISEHNGLWRAIFFAVLAIAARGVSADDSSWHRIVGGTSIYLAVIPVELASRTSLSLRGAKLRGPNARHVVIGLFDTGTKRRIRRAEVRAKLVGQEPLGREKRLAPMRIVGAVGFGGVFSLPGYEPYRFHVRIRRPGSGRFMQTEFHYQHPREPAQAPGRRPPRELPNGVKHEA